VHVVVARDGTERRVDVPDDLAAALRAAGLDGRFSSLAFTHQREYVGWVTAAKRIETRTNRIAKALSMIGKGKSLS